MGRRPSLIARDKLNISLPEDDKAWLALHLFSEASGCVPQGAYAEWFTARLREYRDWKTLDLAAFGLPSGYYVRGPAAVIEALRNRLISNEVQRSLHEGEN